MSQFVITLLLASGIALGVVAVCVLLQMIAHRPPGPEHPLIRRKPPHD